jgi:hypothetical protein
VEISQGITNDTFVAEVACPDVELIEEIRVIEEFVFGELVNNGISPNLGH